MDKEKDKIHIPFRKKIWYSITKFEKYPEMAAEGVKKAIWYLILIMFFFSVCVTIGLVIKFYSFAKIGVEYLEKNFQEINYADGNLSVITENNNISTELGDVIIDTSELTPEQEIKYENTLGKRIKFIWLKEKVIVKYDSSTISYSYKDILDGFGLKEFNKTKLLVFLQNQIKAPNIYILYGLAMLLYIFLAYFISSLLDILILSLFGVFTTMIAKIKMRYRAVFNMSVYAITISTILQLIYIYIKTFTKFNIKYFDLMYTTISFICLAAAIFMIKSDVIRQQIELMKIIENKRREQQEDNQTEDNNEQEEKKEKKEKKENNEPLEKKNEKNDGLDTDVQGQGLSS